MTARRVLFINIGACRPKDLRPLQMSYKCPGTNILSAIEQLAQQRADPLEHPAGRAGIVFGRLEDLFFREAGLDLSHERPRRPPARRAPGVAAAALAGVREWRFRIRGPSSS